MKQKELKAKSESEKVETKSDANVNSEHKEG